MKIGCIVMAAGQSRRFGSNKLLADLGGKPLLLRTLENLPMEAFDRVLAVVNGLEGEQLCREAGVPALRYCGGPHSQTIRLGVEKMLDLDGCLFWPGDQPLCRRESIFALVSAFVQQPELVYRLSWRGQPGSPVLFPRRLFPRLLSLRGEQGGMAAAGAEAEIRQVEAKNFWELLDVDTPETLEKILPFLDL